MEEALGPGDGDPLTWSPRSTWFEIFGIVVAFLRSLETELDRGRGGIVNGGLEFRLSEGLKPRQSPDTEADHQDDAGDEGAKTSQVVLK